MSEQEQFLDSILPDQASNFSKTNISKALRALHAMDVELFHAEEQATPDMTVKVWGGRFFLAGVYTEWSLDGNKDVTTTNSGTMTAPTTDPRIDLMYWDTTSETLGITQGTEAASPSQPAIPDPVSQISVILIYHRVGSTKVLNSDDSTNSYIMGRNVRPFLNVNSFLKNFPKGADIASAAALAPGNDGNAFDVTGTTAITSINSVGVGSMILLQFDGVLTLTHHATDLVLPDGANITTSAGWIGLFHEYAAGDWRLVASNNIDGALAGHITIMPHAYSSITAGTWALISNPSQLWNGFIWNSTTADGDRINYKVYLAVGTYTFSLLCATANSYGILDVSLDGFSTSEGTLDLYTASTVFNVTKTITGITVAASGLVDLSLKLNGKNGSSSDYKAYISAIALFKTA